LSHTICDGSRPPGRNARAAAPGDRSRASLRRRQAGGRGALRAALAEALFVATATVEDHLRNAYRKLGIASRTKLSQFLT
jgi:hypothetical protein